MSKKYSVRVNVRGRFLARDGSVRKSASLFDSSLTYLAESAYEAAQKAKKYVNNVGWCYFGKAPAKDPDMSRVFFRVRERNSDSEPAVFEYTEI